MWVSKARHEYLEEENERLRSKARLLDSLIDKANEMATEKEPSIVLSGECCLLSKKAYDYLIARITTAENELRTLTAERDWYKNAYAQQRCQSKL